MLKTFAHSIVLFSLLFLTSCSFENMRTDMLNKASDSQKADTRLDQIITTIKTQDKDTLKSMFSEQAINEAKNIDEGIDYLFSLIEGSITSWERIGGSVDDHNDYGHQTVKSRYRYNVYTDQEQYLFSILEYTKDTDNSENVGLYCLKVINSKDTEPVFSEAGIYMPEK